MGIGAPRATVLAPRSFSEGSPEGAMQGGPLGGKEGTLRTSFDLYPLSKKRKKEKFKSDIQIDGSACIMYLPT